MRLRHAQTLSAFLGGEHAVKEMITVALEYVADALHLDEIATEANKNAAGREREIHSPKNSGIHARLHLTDGFFDAGEQRTTDQAMTNI